MFRSIVLCIVAALLLGSCRKPYDPLVITAPNGYLVVEGVINPGSDSTVIKLSKTVGIASKSVVNPVIGASVMVQNNQNSTVLHLTGDGHGNYVAVGLNLSPTLQYRLAITTSDGSYQSDFVPVKLTPPIDSVGYNITINGAQLYVNTHDPANNTTFYRWDYQETWRFHAFYYSAVIADTITHTLEFRNSDQRVFDCYGNDASTSVFITSPQRLSKDVVNQSPLCLISLYSEKLETEYSIPVKQYALTAGGYDFYLSLKNNSEQVGGIFAPLPSQANGNIHNITKSTVPVIGYVSISTIQSKRIFISEDNLPYAPTVYPYACKVDELTPGQAGTVYFTKPYDFVPVGLGTFSTRLCGDCTIRGTTQTPSFWK